ncbi:metalloregulator ArsR/SmtB family transcription factor [Actinomycetospora sp. OC33-EN07]|uniref:Metalloregulator ArsR/SmtB family transcription factor n=1 Tax=Actinomycetospora flava TaxID=3129232 RepID=A0ABU8MAD8_9PSEU
MLASLRLGTDVPVEGIAETLSALSTPSRLRILLHLAEGPSSVGDLAAAVGMEQSAVSHQLRVLRQLGFVVGTRQGKQISYRLFDQHVARLLTEAVNHVQHLRLGVSDVPETVR